MSARRPPASQRLPVHLTRFVGRQTEAAELQGMVESAPVLTLVGAPGCGKTRLGIELAAQLAPRFRDGVWFAELAPIADPELVATVGAGALGIYEEPGRPVEDTLAEALAGAELLLLLDNCEHVVDAAAALARHLVAASPSVRIVATSRAALALAGEQVYRVPPLGIDSATELFTDRARLASNQFSADGANAALVRQICERLDGLPLAIELTAAWTRVLSVGQILDRLDRALPLLRTTAGATSSRHAMMEATVAWSYRLLRPAEQRMFDRLAVFAGSFDLEAAGAVAAPGEDALVVLTSLVDQSLVLVEPAAAGPMRYRLLEPVRQCGDAELVARGEGDLLRRRHAEYYLEVARRSDAALRGHQRALALRRLEQEEANLVSALEWARRQRWDLGLQLGAALARFWELRGRVNDGRARLEDLLTSDTPNRRLRATVLSRAGRLAWRQRDYRRARELLEESLTILRGLDDRLGVARRFRSLALVAMSEGDARTAIRLCQQSIDVFRAHGDQQGLAWALIFLGWAHYLDGDIDGGNQHMRDAMVVNRPAGSVAATVNALLGLVYGAARADDVTSQRGHLVDAITAMRDGGGVVEEPEWLWAGAGLAVAEGRTQSAFRLAGAAEALRRRGGTHLPEQFIPPLERLLDPAGRTIGPARADRLKAEGAQMTLTALMAEAIAEPEVAVDDPLTPREREIAELVAQGLTNVQIADRLVISKRTVESHVDHIKQKLGVGSRNQVMAWALRDAVVSQDP
jgi:predicted ATPase/DNA-binding CsgD family transcriptional regulator